jgi:tetratricopeptide (TPR) repeat protein
VKIGDAEGALATGRRALELYQEIQDRAGEGMAYDMLGLALDASGQYREAVNSFHSAIAIYRELRDEVDAAKTYQRLGETYLRLGEVSNAAGAWQHALEIYEQLKHPDIETIQASLRSIQTR